MLSNISREKSTWEKALKVFIEANKSEQTNLMILQYLLCISFHIFKLYNLLIVLRRLKKQIMTEC